MVELSFADSDFLLNTPGRCRHKISRLFGVSTCSVGLAVSTDAFFVHILDVQPTCLVHIHGYNRMLTQD